MLQSSTMRTLGGVCTGYAIIWAALQLYRLGYMSRTQWGRANYFFIAAAAVSFVMRIQHWPFGSIVSMALLFLFPLYYTIWFIAKPRKSRNDVLKVAWLWLHCMLAWAALQHVFAIRIWYTAADVALLFFIYYDFLRTYAQLALAREPEWDFDKEKP